MSIGMIKSIATSSDKNILVTCLQLEFQQTLPPTGPNVPPEVRWVHPISLARIGGSVMPGVPGWIYWNGAYLVETINPNSLPESSAQVFTISPSSSPDWNDYVQETGSTVAWSDIRLTDVVDAYHYPAVTLGNWLEEIGASSWADLDALALANLDEPEFMTIPILHELYHTVAMPNPIGMQFPFQPRPTYEFWLYYFQG
jgi:hypothetical protein